jgi:hypothetical protein
MIGTAHEFQESNDKNSWRDEFSDLLHSLIENYDIQIILEEWNSNRGQAIGETLANKRLQWRNVGTPSNSPEYDTSSAGFINFDPERPHHLMFREYPFEIQERREQYMAERIAEYMSLYERGLLVIGMNHLHSVTAKLRVAQFEVRCGNWFQLCDKGKKTIQTRCHSLVLND